MKDRLVVDSTGPFYLVGQPGGWVAGAVSIAVVGFALYPSRVPLFLGVAALLSTVLFARSLSCIPSKSTFQDLLLLTLAAWGGLSALWSRSLADTLSAAAWFVLVPITVFILFRRGRRAEVLRGVANGAALTIVLSLAVSAVQIAQSGYSIQAGLAGPFNHRNLLGYTMVLCLVVVWTLIARQGVLKLGLITAGVLCLTLSQSRTALIMALLALGIGLAVAWWRQSSRWDIRLLILYSLVIASVTAGALVLTNRMSFFEALGRDATLTGRTDIWTAVGREIDRSPLLGSGLDSTWLPSLASTQRVWLETGFITTHSHSGYLEMAYQLGYVGTVLVSLALVFGARRRLSEITQSTFAPAIGLFVIIFVQLAYNTVEARFVFPFGLLLVCVAVMGTSGRAKTGTVLPATPIQL